MHVADLAPDNRLLLPVREAAKTLGIGQTSTWGLIKKGSLETRKIGGRTLVTMESVRHVAERGT